VVDKFAVVKLVADIIGSVGLQSVVYLRSADVRVFFWTEEFQMVVHVLRLT